MTAIIETGGKQYTVSEGEILHVERLEADADSVITIDRVLAIIDGDNSRFGSPYVEGATVTAKIVKHGRGKKIRIFKYKAKKNYRRRQGHRQPYTRLVIDKISG